MRSLIWFRRDLRLRDNPALLEALSSGAQTLALFVLDEEIDERAGGHRRAYLADSLSKLNESLGGRLAVISGTPKDVIPGVMREYRIDSIHAAREFAPYGVAAQDALEAAGIEIQYTGSIYAVSPGRVMKPDGSNYRVYTPFFKAWHSHGWRPPAPAPTVLNLIEPLAHHQNFPHWLPPEGSSIQEAGETAALARFKTFTDTEIDRYDEQRNSPGISGTSRLSPHLRWGEIHPRTLLHNLGDSSAHEVFRKEIAWREFYADVLHHYPHSSRDYYLPQFAGMRYETPGKKFEAWKAGMTGYPIVDAAMRQLMREGWMHNRSRMIVASFLVKDLHIEWQFGAAHFMQYLIDNDVASNSHGWQWTAGCGTDASPYYRIFNPVEQGKRFDPEGIYIKKYVPELAHLSPDEIHTPWEFLGGYSHGYPERIVDHAVERLESLARLEEIKVAKDKSHLPSV